MSCPRSHSKAKMRAQLAYLPGHLPPQATLLLCHHHGIPADTQRSVPCLCRLLDFNRKKSSHGIKEQTPFVYRASASKLQGSS